jgi:hypothetical protein
VLHDGQPEPGAAIVAAPGEVDPVEPLEDALLLGGRDADPAVGDRDLDVVVVAARHVVCRHDDPGPGVGIDHGVLHQVADRDAQLPGAAQHPTAFGARNG